MSTNTQTTKLLYKQRMEDEDEDGVIASNDSSWLALQDQNHDYNMSNKQLQGTPPSHGNRRVAHSFQNICLMLADVFVRGRKGYHDGTKVHIVILSGIFASYAMFMRKCVGTKLCRLVMTVNSFAMIYDNLVMAMGKYIGKGTALKRLSKLRIILHGVCVPLLILPVVEITPKHGLASASLAKTIGCFVVGFALHEVLDWVRVDHTELILVDNQHSASSTTRTLSGTMHYTSGKMVKMLLPVAILHVLILGVGSFLWRRGATAGPWIVVTGIVSTFLNSLRRPGLQALGESIFLSLLWFAVSQ